jgi:methyl-accepting chemotaxis protein
MNHLKIWEKLLVAFAVLVTANILALFYLAADKREPILTAAKERTGLTYLGPLRQVRALTTEARRLKAGGAGSDALAEKRVAIDLAMTRLDELDLQLGLQLATTDDFVKLKKLWQQLKERAAEPGAAELEAKIDAGLRSLHALVIDTSGLILDPVLDSYYLMEASVVKLENESDLLNRLIDQTPGLAANAPMPERSRDELVATLTLLKADIQAVKSDLGVATDFNPKLKLTLEQPRQQFERSADQLLALFDHAVLGTDRNAKASALQSALEEAQTRTFKLYDITVSLLDDLLKQRIDASSSERNWALGWVISISLIGIFISLWIGHISVTRLRTLTSAVRGLTTGERSGPVGTPSTDEIGTLVGALNDLAVSYRPPGADRAAGGPATEQLAEENYRLKILIADLSLENQALKTRSRAQST